MKRPSWDEYYLDLADQVATRATCKRLKVGAVIVNENKIVSTGYNGSIHGHDHCEEKGCLLNEEKRCIRTLHAELNAVLHAERRELIGATAYITHEPCETCTKTLAQAGILRVVFRNAYPNKYNKHFNKDMYWEHRPLGWFEAEKMLSLNE